MRIFKYSYNKFIEKKPTSIKGSYFVGAYLTTTMGPSWKINVDTIDPRNRQYMMKKQN